MGCTNSLCGHAKKYLKRGNLLTAALIAALWSASYCFSIWHNSRSDVAGSRILASTILTVGATFCGGDSSFGAASEIDFETHHTAEKAGLSVSTKTTKRRALRACTQEPMVRCLVPAPPGYRNPFPWPASRGVVWAANVAHGAEFSTGKNWIRLDGDKLRFTDAGAVDAYVNTIDRLVPASVRTALDVSAMHTGSWGAHMLSRGILAMSVTPGGAPEDAHVELALERGVPAMFASLSPDGRLPYPARAFDMAHCGHCLVPWRHHDGLFLIEIDRVLRPGGYWVLSGAPANWSQEQAVIESVATSLCWKKIGEKGAVAAWQKPINHVGCKVDKNMAQPPQFCTSQNRDAAWSSKMEACITPLPEVAKPGEVAGGGLDNWPERLTAVPPTISSGGLQGVTAETFSRDAETWKKRVGYYKAVFNQLGQKGRYRNLLDMNARLGGFAAALVDDPVWVMNVAPPAAGGADTLRVIYERGLIGTYHDWCEAMPTYPRTYDLLHADSLFTLYKDRCEMEDILWEMDRILRPDRTVIIRDDVDILMKIKRITDGMRWDSQIVDHEDGRNGREKLLLAVKTYWTAQDEGQVSGAMT